MENVKETEFSYQEAFFKKKLERREKRAAWWKEYKRTIILGILLSAVSLLFSAWTTTSIWVLRHEKELNRLLSKEPHNYLYQASSNQMILKALD